MPTKIKKSEHNFFDKLSKEWWDENGKFRVLHEIRPLRMQYILDQLNSKKINNLEVLDLGCGGGLISESLARLKANVTGIDFVKSNIDIAKAHAKNSNLSINYIKGDIENLNLNKKFDLIVMFEVLEHLDDWKRFLVNISRNLKKNGLFVISTINRNILSKYTAIYFAENILGWIPKGTHEFEKFIKPEEIKDCMNYNNFIFKDITGLVFNPLAYEWKLSKNTNINYFCSFKKIN